MPKKIRINLTQNEIDVLNHITSKTKTDCWFCLDTDKEGFDCVRDLEKGYKVTLRFAVAQLYEATSWMTINDWEELGIDIQEIIVYTDLLNKLEILKNDSIVILYAESGLNPSICPYCGSENTEQIDFDWDNASAKHICRDCNQDYIAWYDDTTEECYEITDRHNKMIKKMED